MAVTRGFCKPQSWRIRKRRIKEFGRIVALRRAEDGGGQNQPERQAK